MLFVGNAAGSSLGGYCVGDSSESNTLILGGAVVAGAATAAAAFVLLVLLPLRAGEAVFPTVARNGCVGREAASRLRALSHLATSLSHDVWGVVGVFAAAAATLHGAKSLPILFLARVGWSASAAATFNSASSLAAAAYLAAAPLAPLAPQDLVAGAMGLRTGSLALLASGADTLIPVSPLLDATSLVFPTTRAVVLQQVPLDHGGTALTALAMVEVCAFASGGFLALSLFAATSATAPTASPWALDAVAALGTIGAGVQAVEHRRWVRVRESALFLR
mmetsp:Transcript_38986/g.129094  ORF Transcript_38986/g.129094 Transcript_38986/m.129094 type:complete len:278 (-) Transcript_38986:142-975(-)